MTGWIVRTQINWGWGEKDLRIGYSNFDGTLDVVLPFTMKHYERNSYIDEVTIKAGTPNYNVDDFLQAVVDHAAVIGIFPRTKSAPDDELKAVRYHLEDMRKLVFDR